MSILNFKNVFLFLLGFLFCYFLIHFFSPNERYYYNEKMMCFNKYDGVMTYYNNEIDSFIVIDYKNNTKSIIKNKKK